MVSTRKKRQSNRRLLSQLVDFDQDIIPGNAASEKQENTVVNEGTNDLCLADFKERIYKKIELIREMYSIWTRKLFN